MLTNYHTHTVFSDGVHTPEEVVLNAIQKGFSVIGFSDHGNTPYDLRYCMTDTDGYRAEIYRLKKAYKENIEIYLGIEEDCFAPANRDLFDYVIGSCHYVYVNGKYYPFDSSYDYFKTVLALFDSPLALAERYYEDFFDYIEKRKPDVIGHFDLITKYEETQESLFLSDERYWNIAKNAVKRAVKCGCIFEVNTGTITRGYRTTPCPHPRLLETIKKENGKILLSSDSHHKDTLNAHFDQTKTLLKELGFDGVYDLRNGKWQKEQF